MTNIPVAQPLVATDFKFLIHAMPGQPTGQGRSHTTNDCHRPILIDQLHIAIAFQCYATHYHQEITQWIKIGQLLYELRHIGDGRGETGEDDLRHQQGHYQGWQANNAGHDKPA